MIDSDYLRALRYKLSGKQSKELGRLAAPVGDDMNADQAIEIIDELIFLRALRATVQGIVGKK